MHRNWPWLKWMVPELIILGDKDSDQFPAELPPGGNVELVVYQFRIREMLKEYPARHFWIAASHSWATKPKYTYFHPKLIQTLERA